MIEMFPITDFSPLHPNNTFLYLKRMNPSTSVVHFGTKLHKSSLWKGADVCPHCLLSSHPSSNIKSVPQSISNYLLTEFCIPDFVLLILYSSEGKQQIQETSGDDKQICCDIFTQIYWWKMCSVVNFHCAFWSL